MRKVRVRPSEKGLIVKKENGQAIPYTEQGVLVRRTTMIGRYLKDGDLVIVKEVKEAKPKQGKSKKIEKGE